ncbi:MAG TPA: ATP-binding cassette domain-containing protein [Terriglobales bacterium]|nr:ATP-binding cassette domain-containing protein [Terriglobales bacterium]
MELRELSGTYGGVPVVHGVSFVLRQGEGRGDLGANGSGKTTTVRMQVGWLPPTNGEILYEGRSIAGGSHRFKAGSAVAARRPFRPIRRG